MKAVRAGGTAAGALGCRVMRVPQAPQKANPGWTVLPHVGQMISPAGPAMTGPGVGPVADTCAAAPGGRAAATGGGVTSDGPPPLVPVTLGPGVAPKDGMGFGIFGESFQGMPPRGFAAAGEVVRSSPATADAGGPGGSIVRAVSSEEGSGAAAGGGETTGPGVSPAVGAATEGGAAGAGAAAGFTSSLPQPRQNL
jgi:hypothetical protein